MKSFLVLLGLIGVMALCASLSASPEPTTTSRVAAYYDGQLDTLSATLERLQTGLDRQATKTQLRPLFLRARLAYKRVEFIVAVIDAYAARHINGADQSRNEDDSPVSEEVPAHGLQVIERILYASEPGIDTPGFRAELKGLLEDVSRLRHNKDRQFQLRDVLVWQALRYGMYRLVSLGLTDFDVPLSQHALPETRAALASMREVVHLYKENIGLKDKQLYQEGDALFAGAIAYISKAATFNQFDRLAFIRTYLDPLSVWITSCAMRSGFVHDEGISPLYADAGSLFGPRVFNIDFFSPNERYRLSPERVALGRLLFYDTRLSGNGGRSCVSCHQPARAYTDGLALPLSLDGSHVLSRNTPTLWNTVFQTRQFYDSRTDKLENQLSAVVHNPLEMNGSLLALIPELQQDTAYAPLFSRAYRDGVTEYNIANAISCYVRTLAGFNTRFDRYMRHEPVSFTTSEQRGFNLFTGKARCATCHYIPLFNGLVPPRFDESESEILAVPATTGRPARLDPDEGKYLYTKVPLHRYAFKTPTLRNIALTAPYMHNGVYKTLQEVMEFYNNGGGAGLGINPGGQTLSSDSLHLSTAEINDIIHFMYSLSDTAAGAKGS